MPFACLPRIAVLSVAALAVPSTVAGASMIALPPQGGAMPDQSYVTANVHLRTGPGTNHASKGRLVSGDFVDIVSCQPSWCRVEVPARGEGWIARRYIREAVAAGSPDAPVTPGRTIAYGNDALPSAEMTAFEGTHARLGYPDARIEYDGGSCALYVATGPDGRTYRELLRNPDRTTICRP